MKRRAGFTIVELLVVVAIIFLLVTMMLPTLGQSRAAARSAVCISNQHQLYVAWWNRRVDLGGNPSIQAFDVNVWGAQLEPYLSEFKSVLECPEQSGFEHVHSYASNDSSSGNGSGGSGGDDNGSLPTTGSDYVPGYDDDEDDAPKVIAPNMPVAIAVNPRHTGAQNYWYLLHPNSPFSFQMSPEQYAAETPQGGRSFYHVAPNYHSTGYQPGADPNDYYFVFEDISRGGRPSGDLDYDDVRMNVTVDQYGYTTIRVKKGQAGYQLWLVDKDNPTEDLLGSPLTHGWKTFTFPPLNPVAPPAPPQPDPDGDGNGDDGNNGGGADDADSNSGSNGGSIAFWSSYGMNEHVSDMPLTTKMLLMDYQSVIARSTTWGDWNHPNTGAPVFARHPGGRVNVLMMDGSAEAKSHYQMDPSVNSNFVQFWSK